MPIDVKPLAIPEVVLITPPIFRDPRGFFSETYNSTMLAAAGIGQAFVQDNHALSRSKGVLRGLHFQIDPHAQGKLVRVVRGAILDVAVDIRRGSPSFGRWVGVQLSADDFRQLYLPPGFLHGFCVLTESADVAYKCTAPWSPADEISVRWDDPDLAVVWPIADPVLSARDAAAPRLADLLGRLPRYAG